VFALACHAYMLQCGAVCCSYSVLQRVDVFKQVFALVCYAYMLYLVAVWCSVLQCVAIRYGVLQCVAVCCYFQASDWPGMLHIYVEL